MMLRPLYHEQIQFIKFLGNHDVTNQSISDAIRCKYDILYFHMMLLMYKIIL